MSTISTAKLKVSSEGAKGVAQQLDQVGKATDRVGRAQTRLGQASASAGRQFSAQASGLGGLVAAYAGAAATVFALQAAFDALNKAARADTIIKGTKTLAAEIGQSGPKILKQITSITQGQIELSEAAQNINIALSAGFNTDQISRLTKVSLGASRALGRNLTDALQRVVRGAAKLEPELLDELGIFTRIDPAVEAYANKLGIAASQLSNFERRQAFVNAVIDEGERKFGAIDTASGSTQKSLEQLQAQIQGLAIEFGKLIGNTLTPLVNFFKNDFGNTLLLFGGILALVFGKAIEIIGGFVGNTTRGLQTVADNFADKAVIAENSVKRINKAVQGAGIRAQQLKGQDPRQFAQFRAALDQQRSGSVETASQLNRVNRAYKAQISELERLGKTGTKSYSALTNAYNLNKQELQKLSGVTRGYVGVSNVLNTSLRVGAKVVRGFTLALNGLLIGVALAQTAFSFLGIDLLGKLSEKFADATKKSESLRLGFLGQSQAASLAQKSLTEYATSIGLAADKQEKLGEMIAKRRSQIISFAIQEARAEKLRELQQANPRAGFGRLQMEAERSVNEQTLTTAQRIKGIESAIARAKADRAAATGDEAKQLSVVIVALERQKYFVEQVGGDLSSFIGDLATAAGVSSDKIADLFVNTNKINLLKFDAATQQLDVLGKKFGDVNGDGRITFEDLTQAQKQFVTAVGIAENTLIDYFDRFEAGAVNAEKLSQAIAGVSAQIIDVRKSGEADPAGLQKLYDELNELVKLRDPLRDTENSITGISKAFSGDLTKLSTGVFKGLVDDTGKIAENSLEIASNQAEYLKNVILTNAETAKEVAQIQKENDEARKLGKELQQIDAQRLADSTLYNVALKAQAGRIFTIRQEAVKILEAEKIRTVQLQNQLSALADQQKLTELISNDRLADELAKRSQQQQESDLKLLDLQLQKQRQSVDLAEKQFNREKQIVQEVMRQEQTRANLADQQRQNAAAQASRARQSQISSVGNELSELESRAFVMSSELNDKKRELIELERQNAIATFEEQKKLEEKRTTDALKMIDMREKLLNIEIKNTEKYLDSIKQSNTQELALFDKRTKQLADQAARDVAALERDRDIGSQRNINALNAIDREEALFKQQSEQTLAQLKGFELFAESVKGFAAVAGPDGPLVAAFAGLLGITDKESAAALNEARRKALSEIPQITVNRVQDAISQLQTNLDTQGDIFDKRRSDLLTNRQAESRLIDEQITSIQEKLQSEQAVRKLERDILSSKLLDKEREIQAEIDLQNQKLKGIPLERDEQRIKLAERINSLEAQRNQTLLELNNRYDTITRSENRLREAQFESQAIVKDSVTGAFMKLNDALIDGSITMDMVANTFKDMVGNMLREIQQAVFKKTIVDPIAEGIAGSFSLNPFNFLGIGGGGVGNAPTTMFTAQGGRVHMAQGGMPNAATMKRDRVPAMLEPGEFVMRKEAVKEAGLGTMMRLNAAPRRGFAGGGRVDIGGSPAIDKRAQDYMRGGFMSPAEAYAQAARDFGAGGSSSMRGIPSRSTPSVSGNQALGAIRGMLGQGTPAPVGQSSIGRSMPGMAVPTSKPSRAKSLGDMIDEGLMDFGKSFQGKAKSIEDSIKGSMSIDLAPFMESLGIGPQSSLAPTTNGIMNVGLFDSLTGQQSKSKQKSLADRFKGTKPRTKPQGVGSFFKGVYNSVADAVGLNTIATAGQSVKGFYDGASMIDDQGNIIGGAPTASTATKTASSSGLLSESTIALANSLIGVEGLSATDAMSLAMSFAGSRAGYNPRGNLAGALGATGVQFDLGAIPFVGTAINFGRMISGNPNLGRFQVSPKSIPTARQAATRVEVFNRTGVMATGNKLGFMEGDVTPSGNFMAAGKGGVVSGVDPFAGDKLGLDIATSRAIGNSFRASGTGVEFSSINDFITAAITPGRQSRLTVEEYNAMSQSGRAGYSSALGGSRALSNYQRAQLSIYGGYTNNLGGTTIPGGRFSGTVRDLTRGSFSDNFVSGIASGFSSDPGGGGGYGGVAGGSMGGVSASGPDASAALDSADFAGFAEEASGGLVRKMAAGGAVMSRDRVPALLEPGEFVIRRPMAKAIGGAALNQMNATGKGMKAPDIQVNLSNEGAPKNVQAAAPRISGDKIIIDMITRDLRNNGPIKKSLRK